MGPSKWLLSRHRPGEETPATNRRKSKWGVESKDLHRIVGRASHSAQYGHWCWYGKGQVHRDCNWAVDVIVPIAKELTRMEARNSSEGCSRDVDVAGGCRLIGLMPKPN